VNEGARFERGRNSPIEEGGALIPLIDAAAILRDEGEEEGEALISRRKKRSGARFFNGAF